MEQPTITGGRKAGCAFDKAHLAHCAAKVKVCEFVIGVLIVHREREREREREPPPRGRAWQGQLAWLVTHFNLIFYSLTSISPQSHTTRLVGCNVCNGEEEKREQSLYLLVKTLTFFMKTIKLEENSK